MDIYNIGNDILVYNEDTHQYFLNGSPVMSVTTAMKLVNDKYQFVPKSTLLNAQMRGNRVHHEIQMFENYRVEPNPPSNELESYKLLKRLFNFDVLENETPVIIRHKDITLAGRFDLLLLLKNENEKMMVDIKTTSTYYKFDIALQTALYRLGYNQCYGQEKGNVGLCGGIHLNGNKYKFDKFLPKVDLDMFFNQLEQVIKEKEEKEKQNANSNDNRSNG